MKDKQALFDALIPINLRNDPAFLLQAIKAISPKRWILERASRELRDNADFMLAAFKLFGRDEISRLAVRTQEREKGDAAIDAWMKEPGVKVEDLGNGHVKITEEFEVFEDSIFMLASERLRDDKAFMLEAVAFDDRAFLNASDRLKRDLDLASATIPNERRRRPDYKPEPPKPKT